jgi:hypothetical protein
MSDLDASAPLAVLGPGLVGSWLGAAAGATLAYVGPSRRVRALRAALPSGIRTWNPRLATFTGAHPEDVPLLVACRAHQAPWATLPASAVAAQNGLGQPRAVVTCFVALDLRDDGAVAAVGPRPRVALADPGPAWEDILGRWSEAGIRVSVLDDPRPAQWEKAILNATVGPLCLATGLGMGAVWAEPELRALTIAATREGAALAEAAGVALPGGVVDRASEFFGQVGAHQPSVVRDSGELPWVLGRLLDAARTRGVGVPALARIAGMAAAPAAATAAGGPGA